LIYGLFDQRDCQVIRLTVIIHVGVAPAETPSLGLEILRAGVEKVCSDNYSHAVTVYWSASGGTPPLSVGPISVIYPDGKTQTKTGYFPESGSTTLQASLSGGGTITIRIQARDGRGQTRIAERKVELSSCLAAIIPPITVFPLQLQLEVRAQRTIYVTPGYEELNVPIQLMGEGQPRTTPFTVNKSPRSRITLQAPARTEGGSYGLAFRGWDVWVGDAKSPVRYPGTINNREDKYSLTLTLSANTKVVAIYEDIIG
jgi:hypothetical protein